MDELHALVDFENVQPSFEELGRLAPNFTNIWLFHGPNELKRAERIKLADSRVTLVPHAGKGKNALDFHLSFYLGYVAAKHPQAHLVVVANDTGYDPMLAHARLLKFTVRRVGYKAKPAAQKAAKSPTPKAAPAAKAAPAKKAASAKTPTPAKKAAAKKVPAKKVAIPKPVAPVQPKVMGPALSADAKVFARIKRAVSKMGAERPTKMKSFLRHIGALMGQGSTAEQIDAVVAKLEKEEVVRITGDAVKYLP